LAGSFENEDKSHLVDKKAPLIGD